MSSEASPTQLPGPFVPLESAWPNHVLVLCIVLPILASLAVIGRFVAKRKTRARLRLDDALIVAALVHSGIRILKLNGIAKAWVDIPLWPGFLRDHWQVVIFLPPSPLPSSVKLTEADQAGETPDSEAVLTAGKVTLAMLYLWVVSLAFAKGSVCIMLLNIFGHDRTFKLIMCTTIFLTTVWTITSLFTAVLSCNPASRTWDRTTPGTCDGIKGSFIVNALLDILVDLILAVTPLPFIWRLKQTTRVQIALSFLFALTLFDMALSVLRGWADGEGLYTGNYADLSLAWFFGVMEPGVAIIIASAILMKPLLDMVAPTKWIMMTIRPMSKSYRNPQNSSSEGSAAQILESSHRTMEGKTSKPSFNRVSLPTCLSSQRNEFEESQMTEESLPMYPDKIFVRKEVIVDSTRF